MKCALDSSSDPNNIVVRIVSKELKEMMQPLMTSIIQNANGGNNLLNAIPCEVEIETCNGSRKKYLKPDIRYLNLIQPMIGH